MDINIDGVITMAREFVKNENGIQIKKCCASCMMRKIDPEGKRICLLYEKVVEHDDVCKKWEMTPEMQNAGLGIGKVKSRRYLTYFRERWIQQRDDLIMGRINGMQMMSVGEIRKEFEREVGTIYVEM